MSRRSFERCKTWSSKKTVTGLLCRLRAPRSICPVGRVGQTVEALLTHAQVRADAVDTVFFTGGSSGVPLLRQCVGELLPAARRVEGDLFGSIGAGLALDAVRKFG